MNKSILLAVGSIVILVVIGTGIYFYFQRVPGSDIDLSIPVVTKEVTQSSDDASGGAQNATSSPSSGKEENKPLVVRELQQEFVADFSDPKILVGGSQYVFVGKIIKEVSNETNISWRPRTQFEVEVVSNVKGNLQGRVIVSQIGGYLDGVLYVANSDLLGPTDAFGAGRLLQVGSTYLLPTRHITNANWGAEWYHVNSFPGVIKLISQDSALSNAQLQNLAENDSKVKQLQAAYPNEILLDADIRNNYTVNSYKSLTEAQKYALPYYAGSYNPSKISTSTATSTQ